MSDATAASGEFLLTQQDFSRVCRLIYQHAGIALGAHKRQLVYSRLSRRLRALRLPDFATYLRFLESDPQGREWQEFINALTTNLTSFFREAHHFPVLADHARLRGPPVRVWCAAASTGEEPYSIAMTLVEALGPRANAATVLATDIDTSVLARGEAGLFSAEQAARLSPERLRRFFLRGAGASQGRVRVRPELAAMVSFRRLNLLDESWDLPEPFDAIFCRNVMIYFDKPTQARVLARLLAWLKPDGLLFAGHSENFTRSAPGLRLRGQTVYERAGQGKGG